MVFVFSTFSCDQSSDKETGTLPYKNPALSIDERVEDLLGRMTVEEKTAQTMSVAAGLFTENGIIDTVQAIAFFKGGIGQVRDYFHADEQESVHIHNWIQRYLIENTRLGIPAIIHGEGLHGYVNNRATSFPQAIAMASTWNMELIDSIYTVIAREARSRGVQQLLSPVVDVVRDPRWGRYSESYGEDPYLTGEITVRAVKSLQGDTLSSNRHVIGTLKHFPGHGSTLGGLNCAPLLATERELHEIFLYPFKQAVQRASAGSVMASYGEYDGIPTHTNSYLLRDVLRKQWGFEGFVVSDYFALKLLTQGWQWEFYRHFVAEDTVQAAAMALKAGVNMELPDPGPYISIADQVKEGKLSEELLDSMVGDVLKYKFRLGLFENPYANPDDALQVSNMPEAQSLALESAKQAIVMLKNEKNVLPISQEKYKTIAVIGPNANNVNLGDYSTEKPKYYVTVLEGIKKRSGGNYNVQYNEGCKITLPLPENQDQLEKDRKSIEQAVEIAKKSDIVILAVGGDRNSDREGRDRSNLQFVGLQNELIHQIEALGKPIVLCIFGAKIYAIPEIYKKSDAIFQCWNLGQETGNALASVLFGDYSPSGKLTVSIPISEGHLPVYYNKKPSLYARDYMFESNPGGYVFPFGFGLSYTSFEIDNVRLEKNEIQPDESVHVYADITNTGSRDGAEVVQMYLRDNVSSVTRRMKELKDFERVYLTKGETATVEFIITPEKLSFYDRNMNFVVEPGDFTVMVGSSSKDEDLQEVKLRVK